MQREEKPYAAMYKKQHIHFVGVGGIGMSGLAQVLLSLGYSVSGSDLRSTGITKKLASDGAVIFQGHRPENIQGADVIVVSSAVKDHNPEVASARTRGIPIIPRAEMLGELMRFKRFGIAVAGAHGKTSTTSMVAAVLQEAGLDPTVIIGGKVKGMGTNALWGKGEFLVAEADESDGSFLRLTPSMVVVTNIDREHLDFYSGIEEIEETFLKFMDRIPFYGAVIACGDDEALRRVLARSSKRQLIYGTGTNCMLRAVNIDYAGLSTAFDVELKGQHLGRVSIKVPGIHHVRNALAAVAVGLELELAFEAVSQGLFHYNGVGRRFEILGMENGITIVDDYAHHPTEIKATLSAARKVWPENRLVVLFEPHRYTRTQMLMDEFAAAFEAADEVWITEIYPASEPAIVGVSGKRLARVVGEAMSRPVHYVEKVSMLPKAVIPQLKNEDVVMTLGAGAITKVSRQLFEYLKGGHAAVAV